MASETTPPAQPEAPAIPGATRWRKKPSTVEAIQWTGANFAAVKDFASGALGAGEVARGALPLWVVKSQALCHVQRDDWILREPDGSGFYPCAADVFAATYEPAGAPVAESPSPAPAGSSASATAASAPVSEEAVDAALAAVAEYQRGAREAIWSFPSRGQVRAMLEGAAAQERGEKEGDHVDLSAADRPCAVAARQ